MVWSSWQLRSHWWCWLSLSVIHPLFCVATLWREEQFSLLCRCSERLICPRQNTWRTCAVSLFHIILSHLIKSLCFHCLLSARTLPNQFLMKSRSWHLYVLHPGLLAQRCLFCQHSLRLSSVRPGWPTFIWTKPKGVGITEPLVLCLHSYWVS